MIAQNNSGNKNIVLGVEWDYYEQNNKLSFKAEMTLFPTWVLNNFKYEIFMMFY